MLLEKNIHQFLSKWPWLKNLTKFFYQMVFQAKGASKNKNLPDQCLFFKGAFFGFHDVTPWSHDCSYIAFHMSHSKNRKKIKTNNEPIQIGIYDINKQKTIYIAETQAFNWQQGARLQWRGKFNQLIWNTFQEINDKKQLCSILWDCEQNKILNILDPIYSISNSGEYFTTVNFKIIETGQSGYGYIGNYIEETQPKSLIVKSFKGETILAIMGDELKLTYPEFSTNLFITHTLFSPDDSKVSFFIREKAQQYSHLTKLVIVDIKTKKIIFTLNDCDVVTHYCWLDKNKILAYARYQKNFNYILINIINNEINVVNELRGFPDGHPFAHKDKIIFDTYPDRSRLQNLFQTDINFTEVKKIGSFFSPIKFSNYARVDLHPRISPDGKFFAVDCTFKNIPSLFIGPLKN